MTIARFLVAVSFISVLFFFEPVASAEKANETAFARLLVEKSPWRVTWEILEYSVMGRHTISFDGATKGAPLTGRMFDLDVDSRSTPGPLKNIALKPEKGNCIRFNIQRGHEFNYCLTDEGTLKGTMEGISGSGKDFEASAVAKPKE